ncbi:MAG: YchJ family metal-binding protein [Campylobacterota bacterium]|nr:YchJ family metal-binding protein [Campylobacterota bacterium]
MKDEFSVNSTCPCGSGDKYKKCCQPFHKGKLPKNALELMKSRYTAYKLGLADYIIKTTHTSNKDYNKNTQEWKNDILGFCKECEFKKLEIIDFKDDKNTPTVSFKASIICNGNDCSFTEKSSFKIENKKLCYFDG